MSYLDACFQCNRPMWQHERDKLGNVVRKLAFRDASSPHICIPSVKQQKALEVVMPTKQAFRQKVRGRKVA